MASFSDFRIAVVGLGYVGLPLGLVLSRHFSVTGYDSSDKRRAELEQGIDATSEVASKTLCATAMRVAHDFDEIRHCNIYIVTVPTPIDAHNEPDLSALRAACRSVGGVLAAGDTVVFESTVYPGATEEICGPELEHASGLECGREFFLGYSPERINPGDELHTIETVCKVVAGQTPEVTAILEYIYGTALTAGVHLAPNIKTAEAAKVIENAQRDINIAFINEITMIFQKMGIDTSDVLAAAQTKWNFLNFQPGLVGGHCIGVDPFYLAHAARQVGHDPAVILAGRRINDGMAAFIAEQLSGLIRPAGQILVLGLTFKENVSDLRNSKVADLVEALKGYGHEITVHDLKADRGQAKIMYNIDLIANLDDCKDFDAVIGAVAHHEYGNLEAASLLDLIKPDGLLVDLKGIWRNHEFPAPSRYWQL
jgi:UDP-N-acetyl-D-glucosamine/UDP-N-acetyl-D-galactosamine dehydrogenase